MATIKDQIRAEIERRFWDYGTPLHDEEVTKKVDEILDFLDTLPEQPVEGLEEAARHVWESWNGGTMYDVRRDVKALGNVLNARKED